MFSKQLNMKFLALMMLAAITMLTACGCEPQSQGSDPYDNWQPVARHIMTKWASEVSPENSHPEYPRPQMVREQWQNLNGLWEYAITVKDSPAPQMYNGKILVPFAIESALSGVGKTVDHKNRLWYRRTFTLPRRWAGKRTLLNFGAVDWDATVWVNGKQVGNHKGGYDPFTFDITAALKKKGLQEIIVSVWDPTDKGTQPRGKQVDEPGAIWYTSVTGIWQTVWLEPVEETCIKSMTITTDINSEKVHVTVDAENADGCTFEAKAKLPGFGRTLSGTGTKEITINVPNAKLWSPDSPNLYDLTVTVKKDGKVLDRVESYFGMRKIDLAKDQSGINRLFLNNEPLFHYGPLDQGWWPDGLYTAPTDEALRYDIEVTKKLGCNMLRKHVKVAPARLYYWCDKLGLMVWQDMPNGDRHIGQKDPDIVKTPESAKQFEIEWKNIIDACRNHPSIVMWVPFNEGWGQHDTERIAKMTKDYDPTRLVNSVSGWTDRGVGDVHDIHIYTGPGMPPVEENRAAVLGEFGGLGLPITGHTWQAEANWGYQTYKNPEDLTDAYVQLIRKLNPLIGNGLAAAVYTQTTDVEVEVNGFMTYDRAVLKMDTKRVETANRKLYLPPPIVKTVIPSSKKKSITWRYTTTKPVGEWFKADYDDSQWSEGLGGFGTKTTPGAVVGTTWDSADIWIRRSFELENIDFDDLQLFIHHDEDAVIYINGVPAATEKGYTVDYFTVPISDKALKTLREGTNIIAIHCRQTGGGQYIDAGLVNIK